MALWMYVEPGEQGQPVVRRYTDAQILAEYWDHWCEGMRKIGKEAHISEAACIEDWATVNWAQQVRSPYLTSGN